MTTLLDPFSGADTGFSKRGQYEMRGGEGGGGGCPLQAPYEMRGEGGGGCCPLQARYGKWGWGGGGGVVLSQGKKIMHVSCKILHDMHA